MQRWFPLIVAVLVAGCATSGPTAAQPSYTDDAPPLIAGRIALAEGDAQIWRVEEAGSSGQWDGADVNDVVSAGTGLYTGPDGRSEVRVGPHTFRLAPDGRGGFSQLDYGDAVFNLEYGTLNVRLARAEHGERTAVTVAGVRFELTAPGRYRVDATNAGPARLTVFEGHGTLRSPASSAGVSGSQAIVVQPGGVAVAYEQAVATAFDQWALARDDRYRDVAAARYVSPYMTGYEELDTYGDWVPDATYGTVWYPRVVPVGWAPYRYGQWRWVQPWGWSWVDQAPWGYAPFHYGRWTTIGGRWCWVPGGYVGRPVWAPALVGFVGSGVNVSVTVGAPVVGWYPLAPWHRYQPHYRHNPTYVTIINQTIIHRPPPGVPPTLTHGPGATLVPGPRFREPIHKVALPAQPRPEQLKPTAPPPLNVAPAPRPQTRKFSDEDRPGARPVPPVTPPQGASPPPGRALPPAEDRGRGAASSPKPLPASPGSPPTRVMPPMQAEPVPGRGVAPQPALPGNDPAPLAQPPKRGLAAPAPVQPMQPSPRPVERAQPRPHLPSDQIPPGQAKPLNPAEPPRFPPGAPPTVRQPMAPAARPVQPSPTPAAAPAPRAAPAPAAQPPNAVPTPPPPPARGPAPKEQVLREHDRGKPDHAGPRPKQADK